MALTRRCIHCMAGIDCADFCASCKKPAFWQKERPCDALPARYLLCQKQYYLGDVLGSGGFGITYLAWDNKYRRRVAVKELFPRYAAARNRQNGHITASEAHLRQFLHVKKRFCQEAQALYELRDVPEIIDVYHLFEENGTAYYVMEYLEGRDLKKYIGECGRIPWTQMVKPLTMILRALHALHRKNLIHRDISPDNIFFRKDGGAKLIDFGSARSMNTDQMTKILKERFAPYEQFEDYGNQGPWTDIYSLSITIYYALSGVLPPRATDRYIAWKMQRDPFGLVKPIEGFCPDLPSCVARALRKGMAVTVEQRYHTIQEFAQGLFPNQNILGGQAWLNMSPKQASARKDTNKKYADIREGRQIKCIKGMYTGRKQGLRAGIVLMVGRNADCGLRYPDQSPGISRKQCSLMLDNKGVLYVRDENSTYGTYLDGKRLKPAVWVPLKRGNIIHFAKEQYYVL
ncbi:FHA domain-containing protein [Lachnospiraceae bacterium]|nr:FHA domain-containing protein [Lachnospiraceae bacterium]